jgi:hypothetical protein
MYFRIFCHNIYLIDYIPLSCINFILHLYVINIAFNCLLFTLIVLLYCILDLSPTQVDV